MADYSQYSDEDLLRMLNPGSQGKNDYSQYSDDDLKKMLAQETTNKPSSQPLGGNRALDIAAGIVETPIALATGLVGGAVGLAGSIGAGLIGKSPQEAQDFRNFLTDYYSYKPQSESGKGAVGIASKLTSPLSIPRQIGEKIGGEQWGNLGDVLMLGGAPKILSAIPEMPGAIRNLSDTLRSTEGLTNKLNKVISEGVNKSIRPSYAGRSNYRTANAFDEQSVNAVKSTIADKPNNVFERNGEIIKGENPTTLGEWADVNNNRISRLAEERTAIDAANGTQGVKINGSDVAPIFDEVIKNPRLADATRNAAGDIQNLVGRNNDMTPTQAHELLNTLNQQATAYYEGKNIPAAEMAKTAANKLRETMVNKYTEGGQDYQQLGREMRDGLAIEKDIQRRLRVDKRANKYGFFDIANIASAADLGLAVSKMNPLLAIPAVAIQAIKWRMKNVNKPNYQVKSMFNNAERIMNNLNERSNPTMNIDNWSEAMKEPKPQIPQLTYTRQMPMQDVSGQHSSYVPPIPKPTTKAIGFDRATTPINLGMLDESSVRGIKGELSNPDFWNKNPDLTGLRLKIKNNIPLSGSEGNALLQRIMVNKMGIGKINPSIPLSDMLQSQQGQ